jgi:hypothetical protein
MHNLYSTLTLLFLIPISMRYSPCILTYRSSLTSRQASDCDAQELFVNAAKEETMGRRHASVVPGNGLVHAEKTGYDIV